VLMKFIYGERENATHTGKSVEASSFPASSISVCSLNGRPRRSSRRALTFLALRVTQLKRKPLPR
jgi:hypothetical protein